MPVAFEPLGTTTSWFRVEPRWTATTLKFGFPSAAAKIGGISLEDATSSAPARMAWSCWSPPWNTLQLILYGVLSRWANFSTASSVFQPVAPTFRVTEDGSEEDSACAWFPQAAARGSSRRARAADARVVRGNTESPW